MDETTEQMLVDEQNELMRDLLFTVHQHGGDDTNGILENKVSEALLIILGKKLMQT